MITIEQVAEVERAAKFMLQKSMFARTALQHLETKKQNHSVTGYDLQLAERDAERQERILVAVADELADELTKLLKQATPPTPARED